MSCVRPPIIQFPFPSYQNADSLLEDLQDAQFFVSSKAYPPLSKISSIQIVLYQTLYFYNIKWGNWAQDLLVERSSAFSNKKFILSIRFFKVYGAKFIIFSYLRSNFTSNSIFTVCIKYLTFHTVAKNISRSFLRYPIHQNNISP